ncbi:hypothetical protein [Alienimonas chondri]|uniref:Transmembrane protein n=1 Tax=Alienimonas chondri TaxID=2681879 RepID=A0ABX1VIJ6_9PLAN|nr:hypothetical protein [Alienimonas chondri]NNJ26641.1 hypothetical protein [Alienimonas chondri]
MSSDAPTEPRSPTPADGVSASLAPDPHAGSSAAAVGRRAAAFVYLALWVLAGLLWAAPVGCLAAVVAVDVWHLAGTSTGWLIFGGTTTPTLFASLWAANRTRRSRSAHRRMAAWGAIACLLLFAGAMYWDLERRRAFEQDPGFLAGALELVLAYLCGTLAAGCLALALAGAWGRWVLHRRVEAADEA